MDKVLVEVFIPAAKQSFDTFLPLKSPLHELVLLLANTMTELSEGYFTGTEQTILCNRHTGEIFNINSTVEELGFKKRDKADAAMNFLKKNLVRKVSDENNEKDYDDHPINPCSDRRNGLHEFRRKDFELFGR